MRGLKCIILILLSILAGCGSNTGAGSAFDPFNAGGKLTESTAEDGGTLAYKLMLFPAKDSAMANEEMIVAATLRKSDNTPIANQAVSFRITAGPATVVSDLTRTDSNGTALCFIRTGNTTSPTNVVVEGTALIEGSTVTGYGNIQVSPVDSSQTSTRVSLTVSSFSAAPNEEVVVTATLKDTAGIPVPGQNISFTVTAGPATLQSTAATTDSNGRGSVLVKAGNPPETANAIVEAVANVNGSQLKASIPFQIVPTVQSALRYGMTMSPSKDVVDNNEAFYVTAVLKDSSSIPVINHTVTFAVVDGPATLNTTSINTDSTGRAIVAVRAGNPGSTTAIILQASAMVNNVRVTALAPVQIITKPRSESVLRMVLTSDKCSVGINGDVIMTATVTDMQEPPKPVQNQPVNFSIVAGPATITDVQVNSDSAGKAVSRLKVTSSVNSSANIIVMANTVVSGMPVNAYATLAVVRQNSYVIKFLTSAVTSDPDGSLNTLTATVAADSTGYFTFKQLVPFQVLDNNGVPEPNVDVSVDIHNYGDWEGRAGGTISAAPSSIISLMPPYADAPVTFPYQNTKITVRTDDHGMGIFLCNVSLLAPGNGHTNAESVIFKATAAVGTVNMVSYGGFVAEITQEKPEQAQQQVQ